MTCEVSDDKFLPLKDTDGNLLLKPSKDVETFTVARQTRVRAVMCETGGRMTFGLYKGDIVQGMVDSEPRFGASQML